jgi:hypothetical protein
MSNKHQEAPQDVAPSLLWAMYTKAPREYELVDLPVGEKFALTGALPQLAMVPLSAEETMLCRAEAEDYAKKCLLKAPPREDEQNLAFRSIYDDEVAIRVLWRSCRDPNDPTLRKKVFPGPKPMREMLTLDQIGVLSHAYVRIERLLSPIRYILSKEEMDGLLMRLREGGRESAPLDYLSSALLKELLMHSVSNPPPSPTPSTSPGGQPDSSGSPASEERVEGLPEESPPETASTEAPSTSAPDEPELRKKLILG